MNFFLLARIMLLTLVFCILGLFSNECRAFSVGTESEFVSLGVYMSWERPSAYARYYKIDKWNDVCRRLDAISVHNVDTLWVANMTKNDMPRLIRECSKRNLKLLLGMSAIEAKVKSRWADDGKYYDKVIPEIVLLAGESDTLIGWVLSDEPSKADLPLLEKLRQKFQRIDPKRICLTVTTWPVTPYVAKRTNFPVVCMDLYPFFGPNDPNGPHTDVASKAFYRKNVRKMINSIGDKNILGWLMCQCFVEVWGPWKYDKNFHIIALPGAYMHWRCPTLAEMRWQIWEALRNGCKGVFVFTITPPPIKCSSEKLPLPKNFTYKNVLAKEPFDMGVGALLNPDASVTLHMKEVGKIYKTIAKYKSVIVRWKITRLPGVDVSGGKYQCFSDPGSGAKYIIVLNDDLHKARKLKLTLPKGKIQFVKLKAGEGKIIKID